MKTRTVRIVLIGVLALLLLTFCGCIYYGIKDPNFNAISTISGIASFFVAVLTVFYVYTTTRQIEVMASQIKEMRVERTLSEQPIISLIEETFTIYRPKFYYTPPEDEYSFQSVYNFKAKIRNVSSFTAICVDFSSELIIPSNDGKFVLETVSRRLNIIAPDETLEVEIQFAGDSIAKLFEALREKRADNLPRLKIEIIYKNLVGGAFFQTKTSILAPIEETESIVRSWHTCIVSAPIEAKESIDTMKRAPKGLAWKKVFDASQKLFDVQLGPETQVVVNCIDIPEKFDFKCISTDEYEQNVKDHAYGRFIHKQSDCCDNK